MYEDSDLICFSLYYLSFGDIFNTSRWTSTKELQDPELQRLASLLPAYCLKSKADNTTTKYRYAFNHFSTWCSSHSNESSKLCYLPASDIWNAKLTETQIYRELSIEIESSLFN